MSIPATLGLPGCNTLFDELQANHQIQAASVHGVGAFLPYHRLLMHTHEYFMKNSCNYTGAQPYWDEPKEAGNFSKSFIFDSVYGFGGDGREEDGCITDGPFANYTNSLGPGYAIHDHCIDRNISDQQSLGSAQANVDACYENDDFLSVWPCLENAPHSGGHGGVGLEMSNPISSPGDPIFYLHHTWLDKVWWDWQALNMTSRLTDISGANKQDSSVGFPEDPGNDTTSCSGFPCTTIPVVGDTQPGDPGNTTTLTHVLSTLGLLPNITIADVMDIQGGYLCYEYVDA
ncbi:hypothetical protein KJ359_012795 [Pestalotiopsis sp. 9143b]|nr:hypothetical protein KJ359_012795 [Pestalotiopsis sp. 9143b]